MKKYTSPLIALACILLLSTGCKVGADDPNLSLTSRDARLLGTWRLTSAAGYDSLITNTDVVARVTKFDGTLLTVEHTPTTGLVETSTVQIELKIAEGGNLTVTENWDGAIEIGANNWRWVDTDKEKSELVLGTDPGSITTGVWSVTRLAKEELVLNRRSVYSYGTVATTYERHVIDFELKFVSE